MTSCRWIGLLVLALVCSSPRGEPRRVDIVADLPLPRGVTVDGLALRELSALAWDADKRRLFAASDRGSLFEFELHWQGGRLARAEAVRGWSLRTPGGERIDAEAMAWRSSWPEGDPELWIAPEFGASAFRVDLLDRSVTAQPWPPGVASTLGIVEKTTSHGVEALGWHAQHGMVAARQRAASAGHQEAFARDGTHWRWLTGSHGVDIKALEIVALDRMIVLERIRGSSVREGRFALRTVDLARCRAQGSPCAAPSYAVLVDDGNALFEGLACTSPTECFLVSDDGGRRGRTARLLQVRLPQ